jgi:signal peptidase I
VSEDRRENLEKVAQDVSRTESREGGPTASSKGSPLSPETRHSSSRSEARFRLARWIYAREFLELILAAVFVAVLLRVFVLGVYRIPGDGMRPTLLAGDFIVAWKPSFGVRLPILGWSWEGRSPQRGEVVILQDPDNPQRSVIKRVIALAGDKIEMRSGQIWLNDVGLGLRLVGEDRGVRVFEEGEGQYRVLLRTSSPASGDALEHLNLEPQIIPPAHVFLLGDQRDLSEDSRAWGPVPTQNLIARAGLIWFSFCWASMPECVESSQAGTRWGRLFSWVH